MDKLLTIDEIPALYELYLEEYNLSLKDKGVKFIKYDSDKITQSLYAILFLLKYKGEIVPKKDLTEGWNLIGTPTNDFQITRHLGLQYGYHIQKSGSKVFGWYKLITLSEPHPSFLPKRRNQEFTESEWGSMKSESGNRCWSCGAKEGEVHYKDKTKIVHLEKGHCDPRLPLTLDNTFPQCNYCNAVYKDKFVFDKRGNVHHQINFS